MNKAMLKSALVLGLFAVFATALLLWIDRATHERIAANERSTLLARLNEIVPPEEYTNDLAHDTVTVTEPGALGSERPLTVYRARRGDRPVAAVLTAVAPDGYSGAIRLLIGVYADPMRDGRLAGVRVVRHKETPGLGDRIEAARSDWIHGFQSKSLGNPPPEQWKVRPDGGAFDSLTGATVTPRAVVAAVRRALVYYKKHRDTLFARPAQTAAGNASAETDHE